MSDKEKDFPKPPDFIRGGITRWSVSEAVHRHVEECLHYTGFDYAWAADELGVNVSTLFRWRKRWASGSDKVWNLA